MPVLLRPAAWGAHALVVAAVAATIWLGLWQLSAWEAGRAAEARDLTGATPMPLADAMTGQDAFPGEHVGRPVTLAGSWLPESTLYVADRRSDGREGFWVMTPVLVEDSDDGTGAPSAMPVVRGWSAQPQASAPQGEAELTGWLQPSEGSNLPDPDRSDDVIPEMRVASVTEHVDHDLFSGFVVARDATTGTAGATDGLDAVSPAQIPSVSPVTSLKNLLYAIQWWVFGVFAIYVWQRWCRDQLALRDARSSLAGSSGTGDQGEETREDEPVGSGA